MAMSPFAKIFVAEEMVNFLGAEEILLGSGIKDTFWEKTCEEKSKIRTSEFIILIFIFTGTLIHPSNITDNIFI